MRIYVGCATQLYGDLDSIHLIKAHITSGKVSLMGYDDWNKEAYESIFEILSKVENPYTVELYKIPEYPKKIAIKIQGFPSLKFNNL